MLTSGLWHNPNKTASPKINGIDMIVHISNSKNHFEKKRKITLRTMFAVKYQ